jgi:DNA-binding NtrC family response regulator
MNRSIAVVDASPEGGRALCAMLENHHYSVIPIGSLDELVKAVREHSCHAVILDLDGLPVDNRFVRKMCRENPGLCVIGLSSRTFHPELEESMRTHISACLSKPVDEDELLYWLKSICASEPKVRAW